MSDVAPSPFLSTLRWFSAYAGYPASRLADHAELLVLLELAARLEEESAAAARPGMFHIKTRDGAKDSALRAHALRRSLVHFKCDNSAKV